MNPDRPLDPSIFVRHIEGREIRFSQSARRHRIGRERVRQALHAPRMVLPAIDHEEWAAPRLLVPGADASGRELEVVVVLMNDANAALVIHAMDRREKYRVAYDGGAHDPR